MFATNVCSLRGWLTFWLPPPPSGCVIEKTVVRFRLSVAIPGYFVAQMETEGLLYGLANRDRLQEDSNESPGDGSYQQLAGNISLSDVTPIRSLPTELLTSIFLECLRCTGSINEPTTTPVTLKKVCRLWESIICGLPNAWKNLRLHQYSFADLEGVMNDHFRYRGQHRLKVNISMYSDIEHIYPSKQMKPLNIIRDNFRYFETITGRINPTVLHELFGREYDYDMATIRTLDLGISSWNFGHKPPFLCSPSFQLENMEVLKLYNLGYLLYGSNVKSSLSCLSLLFLNGDHSDYLLDHSMILTTLSVACNLQEFSWTPSQDSGERLLVTPIELPKLTKLHVILRPFSTDIIPILTALEMPHLTDCHIDGYDHSMTDDYMHPTLIYFISTRGSCIQELTLNNLAVNSEIWERMPNLKSLQIEGELGDRFFQCLTDSSTCLKLPKLECLTMSRVFSDEELELLLEFAKSRKDAKRNCARLRTLHINCTAWDRPGYAEFQNLASENMDLDWQVNLLHLARRDRKALDIQFDHPNGDVSS